MRVLEFLVYAFINTFGITRPTPAGARRAARGVGWLLLVVGLIGAGLAVYFRGVLRGR